MFRREAVWLQFEQIEIARPGRRTGPAVKISVGGQFLLFAGNLKALISILGVNALSGLSTSSIEPPKFGAQQDYVVVGQQPWLDGIVSGPGIVRQVSKFLHVKGVSCLKRLTIVCCG
jgi:hypothetical protein